MHDEKPARMVQNWGDCHDAQDIEDAMTALRFCGLLMMCGLSCLLAVLVGLSLTNFWTWSISEALDGCEISAICDGGR